MKWFCLHLFNLFSSIVPLLNPDFLRLSGGIGSGTLVENDHWNHLKHLVISSRVNTDLAVKATLGNETMVNIPIKFVSVVSWAALNTVSKSLISEKTKLRSSVVADCTSWKTVWKSLAPVTEILENTFVNVAWLEIWVSVKTVRLLSWEIDIASLYAIPMLFLTVLSLIVRLLW